MSQSQQFPSAPRRTGTYGSQHDELHLSGMSQHAQLSPRDYAGSPHSAPQFKLDQPPGPPASSAHYPPTSSVPNVLQPGGLSRPTASPSNMSAPGLGSLQASMNPQHDYQSQPKPSNLAVSTGSYRSSPGAYESASSSYAPYTPTTPGGTQSGPPQYMSPSDPGKYGTSQRNVSNTPLGLADIRPRADSTLSDNASGSLQHEIANMQASPGNYLAPWALYAYDWCKWQPQGNGAGKVAIASYLEDGHNFIQILDSEVVPTSPSLQSPGGPNKCLDFTKVAEATHSYPVTRLLWEPPSSQKQTTDLLATSGDHLRLWSLPSDPQAPHGGNTVTRPNREAPTTKLTPLALLSNSKTPDHTAPLTSLDWNTISPSLIITSSIDTTCTIWDIPSLTAKTQLIAHDKEVYDVRFCANSVDVFVSCGQDGSVRMFDLRSLEHSTIIYEPTGKDDRDASGRLSPTSQQQTMANPPPLLRLSTSPHDANLLATFAADSNIIRILDVRQPGQALLELRGHGGSVNCVEWSPLRRGTLASGADDCQVLLWDLMGSNPSSSINGGAGGDNFRNPSSSWQCDFEVGNLGWVPRLGDDSGEWLGVCAGRGVWGVRMS